MNLKTVSKTDFKAVINLEDLDHLSTPFNLDIYDHVLSYEETLTETISGSLIVHNIPNEHKYFDFIKKAFEANDKKNIVIEIDREWIEDYDLLFLFETLDYEDKFELIEFIRIIDNLETNYLSTDDFKTIKFFMKCATREKLFPIFHFQKHDLSLVTYHELSFPMYFRDSVVVSIYKDIAKDAGLFIR